MWPDRVSNPGPLTYDSGIIATALRGPEDRHINTLLLNAVIFYSAEPVKLFVCYIFMFFACALFVRY